MPGVTITVTENGPYKLEGPVELLDQDGHPIESARSTIYLCRCGRSMDKPFCDGSHSRVGFRDAREPVRTGRAA